MNTTTAHWQGVTLLELLVTLTIVSLMISAGVPALIHLTEEHKVRSDMRLLHRTFALAHANAVMTGSHVTLCPLVDSSCDSDWSSKLIMFTDTNNNRILDAGEVMVAEMAAIDDQRIRRSYGSREAVTFGPLGSAFGHNATLKYCFNGRRVLGGTLIVSGPGRIRLGQDQNGNGLPEDSSGTDIDCSS